MPSGDGQISALISFIIQCWWPSPRIVPWSSDDTGRTRRGCRGSSIQPWNEARRKRSAMSSLGAVSPASHDSRAMMCVLEHRRADLVEVDDVEVVGLVELAGLGVLGLEQLGVLVVDHRLGDVDLAVEQQLHVEVLVTARSRCRPRPACRAAASTSNSLPKPQAPIFLPAQSAGDGDAGVLPADTSACPSAGRPGRC